MPQIETGDSGKKRDGRDTDHVTSHKIAGESISSEPMAPAYEPKFKSFSSVAKQGVDQVLHTVSQFCIEDKEKGKVITANGEKSAYEPRPSFMEGLRQAIQGHSKDETERLQAEFSIAYMTRKATQFFQDASGSIVSGFQRCVGLDDASQKNSVKQNLSVDQETGQQTITIGKRTYPASDITGQSLAQMSDVPNQTVPDELEHRKFDAGGKWISANQIDYSGKKPFSGAPDDVFVITAEGHPGKLMKESRLWVMDGDRLSLHTLSALVAHLPERRFFPSGRRLLLVNACKSGKSVESSGDEMIEPGISGRSAAAQLAVLSDSWTIGAAGDVNSDTGEVYTIGQLGQHVPSKWILFDPKGTPRLEFGAKMTEEDWQKAESLSRRKLDWAEQR
ncbi:MAG: hypothetical protein U0105_07580 [Candidatus Obscuribacterales bacterium]